MEPIISPFLVYLVDLTADFEVFCLILGLGFLIAAIAYFLGYGITYERFRGVNVSLFVKLLSCGIAFLLLVTLIPSKETVMCMIGLQMVTPEAIEAGVQTVREIFDYVVNAFM